MRLPLIVAFALFDSWAAWFLQYGVWGLALVAFVESSILPLPPDFLLIPLCLSAINAATPERIWYYATLCTIFSVLGAVAGYTLGATAGNSIFQWLIRRGVVRAGDFDKAMGLLNKYDVGAIFIAAFTPIPYKVFTIAAGLSRMNLPRMIVASILGRGGRFYLVAAILYYMGPRAEAWLGSGGFEILTLVVGVLLVVALFLMYRKPRLASPASVEEPAASAQGALEP